MKKIRFIIPSVITLVLLLVLFYIQGLYPFTNNSLVQVDADYQFIPVLYRIYDFLHGNGNIIYDDIGNGNNIYISMIIQGSIFSPLSLLLYFTSRDNIVNYFNIIVIVKMCLLSLTTYIYINKSFKIKEYYKIVFSVLYAFSGWVLLDYFNVMWLDCVILFPLVVMYLNELLDKGKYLGYVITLSLALMISYYISYFILLFIVFYSFIYIFIKLDKDKVKKRIFCLGKGTVISLMISSFSLLPALYQTFISSRMDSVYKRELIFNFMNKSLYLMFSALFLVIFILLLFKYNKGSNRDKKNIYIYVMLFILFVIGLFVEPINLAIHMGSYWGFPYRYSFIAIFIMMCGSLYYLSRYDIKGFNKYFIFRIIMFVLVLGGLLYLNNIFYKDIIDSHILLEFDDKDIYINILIIFLMICLLIILSLSFKNKIIKYISFSIVCLTQIFIFSSWCIYYGDGYYLSKTSNMLNSNIDFDMDSINRYKMGYSDYTPDYSFIYDVNTLDNWLHILPDREIDLYFRLGYKNSDTCLRSYGGTIFSDWLFNVGYLVDDMYYRDNPLYTMINRYYKYYYYKINYNNGFGLVYDNNNINSDSMLYGFYLQNQIYRDLFNKNSDIIKIDEYSFDIIDNKLEFSYDIDEHGFLYLYTLDGIEIEAIKVDGSYINFKDNDYILDLGMYEDNVLIELFFEEADKINFSLGYIRYDDIMNLSSNVDSVTKLDYGYDIEVYNDMDNGYLFLPINNIDGLKAYVNGNEVEIDSYMNNFVSIKLDKGDNDIEIRYDMPLFKIGIIISIIGIILLLLFNKIPDNKIILDITCFIYIFICLFIYLYIYGYSMIKYFEL